MKLEKARSITKQVNKHILPVMPLEEKFALTNQLRRSAYCIPLNIVEGSGRFTEKDFAHFLDISLASAHKLEYCYLLSKDLTYLNEELYNKINQLINEVKAMLIGLIKALRK